MAGEDALGIAKAVFSTELTNWSDGLELIARDVVMFSSSGRLFLGREGMIRWYRDSLSEVENSSLADGHFEPISDEWVVVRGDVKRSLRGGSDDSQPTTWLVRATAGRVSAVLCYRIEADAMAVVRDLGDTSGASGVTQSFVLRDHIGRVAVNSGTGTNVGPEADALAHRLASGEATDLGEGYRILPSPAEAGPEGAWLMVLQDDKIGAAFAFADLGAAKAALPTSIYQPTAAELAESTLVAFAAGDSTRVLPLLAPDFRYIDRSAGVELHGAVTVLTGLLLAQEQARESGLPALEIADQGDGTARVSGLITDPDVPDTGGRWVTLLGVENGRLKWAERQPNEPAD